MFGLVYSKNFNFTRIFILRLFKMVANQIATGLNRSLSSNFGWLRSANHVKCTEECVMCTGKHVLVKKIFTNEQNMDLPLLLWVKKTVHVDEIHWLSGKEKVLGAVSNKEGDADSLLGHKWTHHYWFPWKRCNCKQFFL